jgi:hypothetical protein
VSLERERERLRVRWGLVPAGALRRWLRLAAYAQGHVPGRYEEVLRDGWSEEWPLVLLRRSDGVTLLLDGRHRLRTAQADLWVPVVWMCVFRWRESGKGLRPWEGAAAVVGLGLDGGGL